MKKVVYGVIHLPANFMRLLIRLYQLTLSQVLGPRCKYYPSCSHYALTSYRVHGFWKGTLLTLWRLLRCNPLSDGGVDYPPVKGSWENPWTEPGSVTDATYGFSVAENLGNSSGEVPRDLVNHPKKGLLPLCC